jgi:hypothetical protein
MNRGTAKQTLEIEIAREDDPPMPLEALLLTQPERTDGPKASWKTTASLPGAVIGSLVAVDQRGSPVVDFAGIADREWIVARSTVAVEAKDVGREVAIVFEGGDAQKPIIVGLLQQLQPVRAPAAFSALSPEASPITAKIDGEQIVRSADKEIVLRCGKASITLTRAGKVLIRGAYLLSRSSGVNRIKGGSVQIN